MVSWKNSKGMLGAVVLCGVVWFAHPAQDRVNKLEERPLISIDTMKSRANKESF